MKFKEIKESVIRQMSELTIDDFSVNPNVLNIKEFIGESNFQNFIKDNFISTIFEYHENLLNSELRTIEIESESILEEIKSLEKNKKNLEDKLDKELDEEKILKTKEKSVKTEIDAIRKDLASIKKANLTYLLGEKQNEVEEKESKLSAQISQISDEIQKRKQNINSFTEEKNNIILLINRCSQKSEEISLSALDKKNELNSLKAKKQIFDEEFADMKFLSEIILRKKIGFKRKLMTSYNEYDNELVFSDLNLEEFCALVFPFLQQKEFIPKNWREELFTTLSQPLPNFSGFRKVQIFTKSDRNNSWPFLSIPPIVRQELSLNNTDYATCLALKTALQANDSIETNDNKIILGLSGGLLASISFKEKTKEISNFQQNTIEFYTDCYFPDSFKNENSYTNSSIYSGISIQIPRGYYILNEKYIIQILFSTTPILFNNNLTIIHAQELLKQKLMREEQERLNDDDD